MLWPGLIYWLHQDADGIPWLLVSRDFPGNDVIRDTLRLDFDTTGIKGGWSPAFRRYEAIWLTAGSEIRPTAITRRPPRNPGGR